MDPVGIPRLLQRLLRGRHLPPGLSLFAKMEIFDGVNVDINHI